MGTAGRDRGRQGGLGKLDRDERARGGFYKVERDGSPDSHDGGARGLGITVARQDMAFYAYHALPASRLSAETWTHPLT